MADEPKTKYDWLLDMKQRDLREALQKHERDALLIYDHCGLDVLVSLWENLPGVPIYPSRKALYELAARSVRKNFDPEDPENSKKRLAARHGVSLRFVELALATTDKTDSRQINWLVEAEKE
jgi:hypothetical protein